MKKSVLTLALVAFFSVAVNAQSAKTKAKTSDKPASSQTVNDDGTVAQPTLTPAPEKKDDAPAKKPGTRMAINEKGASSGVKPKASSRSEEKKNSDAPSVQPGSSPKKD